MNHYEERKAAKIARLESRVSAKKEFAEKNDLSLYGEEKSGIPMGQPILVGHHSEKRHRKHLERIENRVRKGYEAHKEAERLEDRIDSIKSRKAIDSDNPDAADLIQFKIDKLTVLYAKNKALNQLIKKCRLVENKEEKLAGWLREMDVNLCISDSLKMSHDLLTPDFAGRIGIARYWFTNTSAEIRRLKKRLEGIKKIEAGWPEIIFEGGRACLENGRILIYFERVPSDSFRDKLKRSPFVFKWSPSVRAWSRKHTPTTNSEYFKKELNQLLQGEIYAE